MHASSVPSLLGAILPTIPLQTLSTPVLVGLAVVGLIVVVIAVRIAVAIAIRVALVAAVVLAILFGLSQVGVDVPLF